MDEQTVSVRHDEAGERYVATVDGSEAGFSAYRASGDVVTFTHTEIDDRFEGRGVGSRLVRAALDDVRAQGKRVRPLCPFVARYIREHDEYADLVVHAER